MDNNTYIAVYKHNMKLFENRIHPVDEKMSGIKSATGR